jgi:hypothetical protein
MQCAWRLALNFPQKDDRIPGEAMLRLRFCVLFLVHIVCLLLLAPSVASKSATGDRVLVIHEEDAIHHSFSQFFYSLQSTNSTHAILTVN